MTLGPVAGNLRIKMIPALSDNYMQLGPNLLVASQHAANLAMPSALLSRRFKSGVSQVIDQGFRKGMTPMTPF